MLKHWMMAILIFCICLPCAQASSQTPGITLAADENAPVLTLRSSANFRAEGEPCGTSYRLFADGKLEAYTLYARESADESVLAYAAEMTRADYQEIERLLGDAKVMDMPDQIPHDVLDGDTVTLTLRTAAGEKSISSQSPDGLPFGDVVSALERMFRAYENGEPSPPEETDRDDCMPPEPTYTPDMPEYHAREGSAYYGQGAYDKAIASYEAAIALDCEYMNGYYGLAMTYRAMGRMDLSIENYTAVMALAPDYAQPYELRAQIYQFLGRYEEAEADLNQYVLLYNQYPIAYIARGDFYMDRGEYQQAAEDYDTALKKGIAPSALAELYLKRAGAWLKLGDVENAKADFDAALSQTEPLR